MVRAARVAANADKIRALARGGVEDRERRPSTGERRAVRAPSRQGQNDADGIEVQKTPTDILSDGYDSGGDTGSEQVLALLRSGVHARQSMDLNNASSEYKRAASLQKTRKAKPKNKYTIWLRGVAARYGKEDVREAARDIQRCYRGMLGREDAAWHRLQRKKKLKVQQAALDAQMQRQATAMLQRCFRGHRGRLQAGWRRRIREERHDAAVVMQAAARRLWAQVHVRGMRDEVARERAAAFLQARVVVALASVRRSAAQRNAAECLQRVARWALSETLLATIVQKRAAERLAATGARTIARIAFVALRAQEQQRNANEARLEAARHAAAARDVAAISIAGAWQQRRARRFAVQAMALKYSSHATITSTPASPRFKAAAEAGYARNTQSSAAKGPINTRTQPVLPNSTSTPTTGAALRCMPEGCPRTTTLADELLSIDCAASPEICAHRLQLLMATSAELSRRCAAEAIVQGAWRAHTARQRTVRERARRAEQGELCRHSSVLKLQRWWHSRVHTLHARCRRNAIEAAAVCSTSAEAAWQAYGAVGAAAVSKVSGCVRCWQAKRVAAARRAAGTQAELDAKRTQACLTLQSAWRVRTSHRHVREGLDGQQQAARMRAVTLVGVVVCGWWGRRRAVEQIERMRHKVRVGAATRIQALVYGRKIRALVGALRTARFQRHSLLQQGAAVKVWGAWQCAKARRTVMHARLQRRGEAARAMALEIVREERASSVLQTVVRRLWAQWTMTFYVTQTTRLQTACRNRQARTRVAALQHQRFAFMRTQAVRHMQEWWRKLRRRRAERMQRQLQARAAQFQRQLKMQTKQAEARQMEVGGATDRIIASAKCLTARNRLMAMRASAVRLECAWRGSKARDALMWKCLRRQQQDELRFARALATQHLTAHLLRYNFTHRHSLAKSASSHLCAATRAAVQRRKHTFQHAAATTLEARVRATTARLVWVQRWGAGRELCAAVCRHQLRNVAVLRIQTIRAGACVVAGAWRIRRAKNALRNSLLLQEEEDAQQRQLAACAAAAMCLQTCMRRVALQGMLRRRVLSATLILGAHQRNHARRGLTVAMEAAAILNRRARAAVLQVQMTSMMTAARCLAARLSARCARCAYVQTSAKRTIAQHITTLLARRNHMSIIAASRAICRAAATRVLHSHYTSLCRGARCTQAGIRASANRRVFVTTAAAALTLEAVVRRVSWRSEFARIAVATSAIRRCWLRKWARVELKRRREQRARDALLAPALVPAKHPALHQQHAPCPPRTPRRADSNGPSGFRKRLISTGPATATQSCPPPHTAPPLRGCKVVRGARDADDGSSSGDGAEEEEVRQRRLLQEQQARISADVARAGARAPQEGGVLPHEVCRGGSGAALLALRARARATGV